MYYEIQIDLAKIIDDLGLSDLDQAKKEKIGELIKENVNKRLELFLNDLIKDDEEAQKLEAASSHPEILIEYFATKKGVNFQELILAFTVQVKEELIADIAFIEGVLSEKQK